MPVQVSPSLSMTDTTSLQYQGWWAWSEGSKMATCPKILYPNQKTFSQEQLNSTISRLIKKRKKVKLQNLVKEVLKTKFEQVQGAVIKCEDNTASNLSTGLANGDYVFKHVEADTTMFSAYAKFRVGNWTGTVVIDSTDMDGNVQAAYVSHSLRGDLMIKYKHTLVESHAMLSDEVASFFISLLVISGSDDTYFYSHGKKKLLAKVAKDPQVMELPGRVVESLELDDEVRDQIKTFVQTHICGECGDVNCGLARATPSPLCQNSSETSVP